MVLQVQIAAHVLNLLGDLEVVGFLEGAVVYDDVGIRGGYRVRRQLPASYWQYRLTVWREWWQQPNGWDCGVFTTFAITYMMDDKAAILQRMFGGEVVVLDRIDQNKFAADGRQHMWVVLSGVNDLASVPELEA